MQVGKIMVVDDAAFKTRSGHHGYYDAGDGRARSP